MNPLNGDIHHGNEEFFKQFKEKEGVDLVPVTDEQATLAEAMNTIQRKAFAKQERKRQLRLAQLSRQVSNPPQEE